MTKSIFEQMGGTYTQQGDYLLPDLKLPEQEETNIGIWGMRYRQWLKATHRVLYYNLLTKGELNECLAEADERAENMFSQLVSEIAEREGLTEQLKVTDMMTWVRRMNNIRQRASEIVLDNVVTS